MKFNKTTMSLALTAAMFGSVALTQQAFADAPAPKAVQTSMTDTKGDVLLYPYYTIDNGFRTLFHLVNSSSTETTIAKIRLRDYKNSDDVLDFTVILSPNDVFAGTIRDDGDGGVIFRKANDTTCTSPNKTAWIPSDPIDTGNAGHIEVITMATINNSIASTLVGTLPLYPVLYDIVNKAKHDSDGKNTAEDCADVDKYFTTEKIGSLQADLDRYIDMGAGAADQRYNSNLFGHYTIVDFDHGIQGGGRPATLVDVLRDDDRDLHSPCDVSGVLDNNTNICGQFPAHYEFPHLAHVPGVDSAALPADNAQYFRDVYLSALNALNGRGIMNEWSKNSDDTSTVESEWVVTLPTKYIFHDSYPATVGGMTTKELFTGNAFNKGIGGADNTSEGKSEWDDVVNAIYDYDGDKSPTAIFDENGCAGFTTGRFDREEQTNTSGTSTSGGQAQASNKFCNEVATLTFGDFNGVTHNSSDPIVFRFATSSLNQKFGWGQFSLTGDSADTDVVVDGKVAIPMIGYSMWKRDFGAPGTSYGHIMDHVKLVDSPL